MVQEKITFVYHIEQESVSPNEAINCIKGLSESIIATHQAMYPSQNPINIRIKPLKPGSSEFVFDILNHLSQNSEVIGVIGTIASSQNLVTVLNFLGLIKGKFEANLKQILANGFELKKDNDGKITSIVVKNINLTITLPEVVSFFNFGSINVVKNLNTGLVVAKDNPSKGYIFSDREETEEIIGQDFKKILSSNAKTFKQQIDEDTLEGESIKWISPVQGSYGGEDKIYKFIISGSDSQQISAKILDETFLSEVETAEVRLHSSDQIKVQLREIQTKQNHKIKVKYEIVQVLDYQAGDPYLQQISLFDK